MDELLAEGRVARVEPSDKRHTDFLLFAMPPGRPAIEEVRALWRQERVPQGTQLQEELLKRNLRSKDELAKRKERTGGRTQGCEGAGRRREGQEGPYRLHPHLEEYSPGHVRRVERDVQTVRPTPVIHGDRALSTPVFVLSRIH